ncbi:hypothetical protein AK812_SmicGene15789 [Symbiodinium microadriaticum]|uniref:Uncharacterized protein n=1 Tax=Symbiodinium microadriaticum TaxID=2951 RepID=A0A1Q9E244_SYMMI|nr:hypothetical protein AK812_SmicGene15789 [Symbiodinium microadriaticum]CAE7265736.1 unnamed protein product [Symbiodinium microadriaticum]
MGSHRDGAHFRGYTTLSSHGGDGGQNAIGELAQHPEQEAHYARVCGLTLREINNLEVSEYREYLNMVKRIACSQVVRQKDSQEEAHLKLLLFSLHRPSDIIDAECGDLEAIGVHLDDAMLRQVYIRRPSAVPEEGTTKYCAIALAYRHCTSDEFMKLIVQCGHEENIIAEVLGSLSETYRKVYGRAIKAAGTPGGVMPKEQRGSEFYAEDAISEFDLVVSDSSLRAVNKEWPKTNGDWGSLAESLFSKPVRPSEHVDLLGNRAACQHDLMASALEGYKYHGIDVQILDVVPMSYLEAGT